MNTSYPKFYSLIFASIAILTLATTSGCTKNDNGSNNPSDSTKNATGPALSSTVDIGSVGETMAFDKTEITVPAGQKITLNFKNNSSTLQHNWVLTQPGKDNDVGLAGIRAGLSKGFIPDDPAVLAHTKLVDPNKTDTITFTAPPAGDYPYICTNAGHHMVMKGVLHSK